MPRLLTFNDKSFLFFVVESTPTRQSKNLIKSHAPTVTTLACKRCVRKGKSKLLTEFSSNDVFSGSSSFGDEWETLLPLIATLFGVVASHFLSIFFHFSSFWSSSALICRGIVLALRTKQTDSSSRRKWTANYNCRLRTICSRLFVFIIFLFSNSLFSFSISFLHNSSLFSKHSS